MDHILKCHDIVKTDFVRAEGCFLYDEQGRRYIDFESGIWCTALGHGHPRINGAITDQLSRVMHIGTRYPNALAEDAALEVLDVTGIGDGKCVFLSSGSEAVEFGVQTARRVTGNKRMLTFANSYLAAYGSAGGKEGDGWQLLDWNGRTDAELQTILSEIPFAEIGGFVFEPGGSGLSGAAGKGLPRRVLSCGKRASFRSGAHDRKGIHRRIAGCLGRDSRIPEG